MSAPTPRRPIGPRAAAVGALVAFLAIAGSGCGGDGTPSPSTSGGSSSPGNGTAASPNAGAQGNHAPYRGGEKSIEEFGDEAEGSGRSAVLGVFTGYLNAIAARDYASACSHLAATVRRSLEQLAAGSLKGKGCPAILPKLLAPTAPAIAREQAEGRITKVRVEGDRAFVVFHAPGAKLYQMPMQREGGVWKVGLVAASILVPSAATLGQ